MLEGAGEESFLGTVTQPHNPVSTDYSADASDVWMLSAGQGSSGDTKSEVQRQISHFTKPSMNDWRYLPPKNLKSLYIELPICKSSLC